MDLETLRSRIDGIDDQLLKLFKERMDIAAEVARYKKEHNLPVLNTAREREILNRMTELAGEELERYTQVLYSTLFDLSRAHQLQQMGAHAPVADTIEAAKAANLQQFPSKAVVACQGVEGAYSQLACDKLFRSANIIYFRTFDGVFNAVQQGLCQYGILPIENSSAGSVTQVYDLMKQYNFHIARSLRLRIDHCLLAKPGVKLEEITEIVSHEQALSQCSQFIKDHPQIKITVCENTAAAAKVVAESPRRDIAAISSKNCAGLYGLSALAQRVQNSDNNYTRFICISKNFELYPGANKISLMLSTAHSPGALYRLITKFAALQLNLTKLESRPIPGTDFEFMFYFDIDAWVGDPQVVKLLCELQNTLDQFVFLGNYSEVL